MYKSTARRADGIICVHATLPESEKECKRKLTERSIDRYFEKEKIRVVRESFIERKMCLRRDYFRERFDLLMGNYL